MKLYLLLLYLPIICSSCVTFSEVIASPSEFSCQYDPSSLHDKDVCTICKRKCPIDVPDCVTIESSECPTEMPLPGNDCLRNVESQKCSYEPYCGQIFHGSTLEKCMFLATAECTSQGWMIMVASFSVSHPTCKQIRDSYKTQCCDNESQVFKLEHI